MVKCDLKCPPGTEQIEGIKYCCSSCHYATPNGCILPRESRPDRCNEYDCKQYRIYVCFIFKDGGWRVKALHEVKINDVDKEFCKSYNALFENLKKRNENEGRADSHNDGQEVATVDKRGQEVCL